MIIPTNKKKVGSKPYIYPQPVVIIGANVNGKPTYTPISFIGIGNYTPTIVSIGLGKAHYINHGIKENKTFSVNIPSGSMLKELDYTGSVSGAKEDKSWAFAWYYGELKTAPLISKAPVNLECKLIQTIDLPKNEMFLGEVVEVYVNEEVMTDNIPDILKIKPILFSLPDNGYWGVGVKLGKAWDIGRNIKRPEG
jgi:flavin reductase (DIM6/NTAB) family NADH-FMN oxidoreductase RutF